MKKTLLLCFIHGFKGNDDTFAGFPQHIQALLSHALPNLSIAAVIYPTFDTRGDLHECVARVKEWLTNKVIDLEVANEAPSPTVDPSVRTILVGHSMGGIVSAELAMSILAEKTIQPEEASANKTNTPETKGSAMMFPYIQGIIAFDTPYLGISPGVVAHGAEGQWNMGKSAYEAFQSASGFFGGGAQQASKAADVVAIDASKGLPSASTAANAAPAAGASWQRWGKYALFAGAAGALTAGGAAAYMRRDDITQGWTWVGSHLEFVGCLARGEELKKRLSSITDLEDQRGFGFANLYTCLGKAVENKTSLSSQTFGVNRTFCNLPKSDLKRYFHKTVNDATALEVMAHMYMFVPKQNPGYYTMSDLAKELITGWVDQKWYEAATTNRPANDILGNDMDLDDSNMTSTS